MNPCEQGFCNFTRSRSREIHKNAQNPAKFAKKLTKYMSAQCIWKWSWLLGLLTRCKLANWCTYQCQAQGGEGSGIGWGFWHFLKKIVKIPTPGQRIIVKLAETNGLLLIYSLNWQIKYMMSGQNPHPGDMHHGQIPVGCLTPPPLGLDIDRCIITPRGISANSKLTIKFPTR